jgi:probable phosphoglycerate mutase
MREFDEIDFGDWAGLTFAELDHDPRWKRWNSHRSAAAPPDGETMRELQTRVVRGILSVVAAHHNQSIVIVSHAEPIRAALLYFRQIPLNDFPRIKVDPGSLTTLEFRDDRCTVIAENESIDSEAAAA